MIIYCFLLLLICFFVSFNLGWRHGGCRWSKTLSGWRGQAVCHISYSCLPSGAPDLGCYVQPIHRPIPLQFTSAITCAGVLVNASGLSTGPWTIYGSLVSRPFLEYFSVLSEGLWYLVEYGPRGQKLPDIFHLQECLLRLYRTVSFWGPLGFFWDPASAFRRPSICWSCHLSLCLIIELFKP